MKMVFISDIHANLPALKAVLKDIERQQPDDIYCLGDLVNFAGWDNEVIALIRSHNITCLQGNHDEGIGYAKTDFAFSYNNSSQQQFGYASIKTVNKNITVSNRKYLSTLPFMLQLEFRFPLQHVRMALVHGSISSNNEYVKTDAGDDYLLEMMDAINADILLMGHTHVPCHKAILCEEENRKIYRHVINVGSVGKPKHGNSNACYVLLEIDENTRLKDPSSIALHFFYVPYPVQEVVEKIHALGLGNAYDVFLLEGAG